MNKQTRLVFFFLVILLAILAGSTSFFAAKTYKLSNPIKPQATLSASIGGGETKAEDNTKPTTALSSVVAKPATLAEKPSKPADTYTIQRGETLFSIAQSQGTNWQDLAEANGLTDVDKIQAGQALIIPKGGQINFVLDNTRATSLQQDADNGKYQFRFDPVETARSDAPNYYGLETTDTFVLKSNDNGNAQVQANIESKNYIIKLIQPVTKGEKGIWAIESIRPV